MTQPTAEQLRDEGLALARRGEHAAALQRFEAAVHAFAAAGDGDQQAEMLNNIGVVRRQMRAWRGAAEALTAAQAYFADTGDAMREGQALANLADVYAAQGEWPMAVEHYERAAGRLATLKDAAGTDALSAVWRALSLGHVRRRAWVPAIYAMERSLAARRRRGVGGSVFLVLLRFFQRLFAGQARE